MSTSFQKIYNNLNSAQKEAVDTIEGPVMVLAGPGTGKTQVLTTRIANILLKTDTKPQSILALTFTESASKNMRQRLVKMIGKTGYYVQIHTFHSFCSEVIQANPEYFPIDRDSEPLSDLERYEILRNIIWDLDLKHIKNLNLPFLYLRDIISAISNLKREAISVDDLREILGNQAKEIEILKLENEGKRGKKRTISISDLAKLEKDNLKNNELSLVFEKYEKKLREKRRYDFDDMISLTLQAFQSQELLLQEYQENIQYFLVDEYQDTNSAQNKIIDILASFWGDQANIFTVGDPNQAIFRFQGASVENVLGFSKRYPSAKIINLDVGYRCSQNLYDLSAELIKQNQLHIKSQNHLIKSVHGSGAKISIFQAPSQVLEIIFVAEEIAKLTASGISLSDIAIIYRHKKDEKLLIEILEKWGLRFEIDGGSNVLDQDHIIQLVTFFRVLLMLRNGAESDKLFEIMFYDWFKLDKLLVMKVTRASYQAKKSIFDLIISGSDEFKENNFGEETPNEDFEKLQYFLKNLQKWSGEDGNQTFTAWFEMVIKESGYLDWIMIQDAKIEKLNALNSLFNEIKKLVANHDSIGQGGFKLQNFLQVLEILNHHNLKINYDDLNIKENAISLSTAHKAKGQEWNYVFMIHCHDKKWGNNKDKNLINLPEHILENTDLSIKEKNEDERRLFYVGVTRALKSLCICYSETELDDNKSRDIVPSIFVEEIKSQSQFVEMIDDQAINNKADEFLQKIVQPPQQKVIHISEKEFFANIVKDYKLSVTDLNKYLLDPEKFKLEVLLRAPRAKSAHMVFGTAVHLALEGLYKSFLKTGKFYQQDVFLSDFETALEKEIITGDDYKERLAYGKNILEKYYQKTINDFLHNTGSFSNPTPIKSEFKIGSGLHQAVLDDIFLTGKIDRIDLIDKNLRTVRVVDYKTGKHKSINEIEGLTNSADLSTREKELPESIRGPYKRQLLFYKLLAELDKNFNYEVIEGELDFVEPDKKSGKFINRNFVLIQQDVDLLKALIKEVMQEIRELRFL